jgi:hypothetical protein
MGEIGKIGKIKFLDGERLAPSVMSSRTICELAFLRDGNHLTESGNIKELVGETFFRHRLFKGQLPDELKEFFEHPKLEEVRKAFLEDEWDSIDLFKESFNYLRDRIESFEEADGIIALVHTTSKEALPVPFKFRTSARKPGVWDDSADDPKEIEEWSDYLEEIDFLLGTGLTSVKLLVPLGPFAQLVEGRSLMLPIALAMARRDDPTLPPPIEVLATGVVIERKIGPVDHMREKLMLAKRMGARIVAVLKDPPEHSFVADDGEKLTDFIKRWKARFGRVLPPLLENHFVSWRTHDANFKGREKLSGKILDRLVDEDKGGHVALVSPEGMGKSAILTHLSGALSGIAERSGDYENSRSICPWLPGCLLHMGKFGSDPHLVTKSLLVQANSMLSNHVSIPAKPVDDDPQRPEAKDETAPPPPDYHEVYRPHREALGKALVKLVEERARAYLLLDALDEITIDQGFLSIFPDPFPQGIRVMITGRNCEQVDKFLDRRSGFERIEPKKLEREEVSPITGVDDGTKEGKKFNDEVFDKTSGWTYALSEIGKRVRENAGEHSEDMILTQDETLERMAETWKGNVLEDALGFLVIEEFFNCLTEKGDSVDKKKFTSRLTSGDYRGFYSYTNACGPREKDLVSYLKFKGHDLNARKLKEALSPVRDQILYHKGIPWGVNIEHKCISLALRLFPQYCLQSFLAIDLEEIMEKVCEWMADSRDPDALWRLDFLVHKIKLFRFSENNLAPSLNWAKTGADCWTEIKKTWPVEKITKIKAGAHDFRLPGALYVDAILASAEMGDESHCEEVACAYLGFTEADPDIKSQVGYDPERGMEILERLISSNGSNSKAAFLLGSFLVGCDGLMMFWQTRLCQRNPAKEFPHFDATRGISYLNQSMEIGCIEAKYLLGLLYLADDFVLNDKEKGIKLLEELSRVRAGYDGKGTLIRPSSFYSAAAERLGREYWRMDGGVSDRSEMYCVSAIRGGHSAIGLELLEYGFEQFRKSGRKDSELLNFANRILTESLDSMFKIDRIETNLLQNLKDAIVGIKHPDEVGNVITREPLGVFAHTIWQDQIQSAFDGSPFWIYIQDTVISDYLKSMQKRGEFAQLDSLGWDKDQVKEIHQPYADFTLKKLDLVYIFLLNVSETIKYREMGRAYREALKEVDQETIACIKLWLSKNESAEDNLIVKWAKGFIESLDWFAAHNYAPVVSGEFPYKLDGEPVLYHKSNEKVGGLSEKDETHRLFYVNGPVAVLPIIDWINWDTRQSEDEWSGADERVIELANSGFTHLDKDKIPWHNPGNYSHPFGEGGSCESVLADYNWLAREGHPLYDLSVGMLVRHGIYEDPDGLSHKQRFDMARKGEVRIPEWMDEVVAAEK